MAKEDVPMCADPLREKSGVLAPAPEIVYSGEENASESICGGPRGGVLALVVVYVGGRRGYCVS